MLSEPDDYPLGRPLNGVSRLSVLGTGVDAIDFAQALASIEQAVDSDRQALVLAVNPEKVIRAEKDEGLSASLRKADLLIPDGIGVVIALRLAGHSAARVPGSELMPALVERAAGRGWGIYLLGASQETNNEAAKELLRRHPGLKLCGRRDGYFPPEANQQVVAEINASKAKLLFVALGSPKQELWLAEHAALLEARVLQGVGGTFDVIAGRVRRAPPTWRQLNLEWLYRLLAQPSRFLRQGALPQFAIRVLVQSILGQR